MVGDKEAVGRTHCIVDKLIMSENNEQGGLHHLVHLPTSLNEGRGKLVLVIWVVMRW